MLALASVQAGKLESVKSQNQLQSIKVEVFYW